MRYKREETFRYEFGQPLDCVYRILRVNGVSEETKHGNGKLFDISPTGIKLQSPLDLQSSKNEVDVELCFTLVAEHTVTGKIVWQKLANVGQYFYGIDLEIPTEVKEHIIHDLKEFIQVNKKG
ncbi:MULTISPECIES: PilZ domain-containing protein [Bacillaceae]|uniref:PilZ domain-containing protein n=1 Tax=Evansella alkalicola TaxID=745819 RepID=A0ABS6JV23_9BACI|nr:MULTISPECIES: PilZ domain-containing protein [Bacillaceae]MBU9722389.1 PilZ domain-containing protein [Bacillus alkalicola]